MTTKKTTAPAASADAVSRLKKAASANAGAAFLLLLGLDNTSTIQVSFLYY